MINLCKDLQKKSLVSSLQTTSCFESVNYFNVDMLSRMRVEKVFEHDGETLQHMITCMDWSDTGNVLLCGRRNKGVDVFTPFKNDNSTQTFVMGENCVVDAHFMPQTENLFAVVTQHNAVREWSLHTMSIMDEYIRIFDVTRGTPVNSYWFSGSTRKMKTAPDHKYSVWFNVDRQGRKIGQVDVREKELKEVEYMMVDNANYHERSFDINQVDSNMIAISGFKEVSIFDRRMASSSSFVSPFKTLKLCSNNTDESFIYSIKFHPNGRDLLINYSDDNFFDQMSLVEDFKTATEIEIFTPYANTTKHFTNPNFLGAGGEFFTVDVVFNNFTMVFKTSTLNHVGDISVNRRFSLCHVSKPHPFICMLACSDKVDVCLMSPTGVND